ncbi:pyridoxal-phosphate dependent enzyme [Allosphingosinicella deserti]|uniref:PLP-dependent lyase/thiolase n=1 Tax=Allosphingosinicella deserti TaxID=2116704 RepID=A0A2P7QHA1_9SPHN|nr:pyridoxal-phosphate dependent enzyme [Sphingomonas deserti]PSJ37310.1 PLP-dependent lyase/thiolase [Sphingomonas deserti]
MEFRSRIIEAFRTPVVTPLVPAPSLARRCGIAAVHIKDESKRPFGNFKMLGGLGAGLKALARHAGLSVDELLAPHHVGLPPLLCASDGNHGLAVAAAAHAAGGKALIFLPAQVDEARAGRIAAMGGDIRRVAGTYDDAVDEARMLAGTGGGLLVADTSDQLKDPVVGDVMAGYGRVAEEILNQNAGHPRFTHAFIQAGVGGLAAAMAQGLAPMIGEAPQMIVVEPERAACVAHALRTGFAERIAGTLDTKAEMLSCGIASASAVEILRRHRATAVTVSEAGLAAAVSILVSEAALPTTPSGAAGLTGLLRVAGTPWLRTAIRLGPGSRVLLVVTEGAVRFEGVDSD